MMKRFERKDLPHNNNDNNNNSPILKIRAHTFGCIRDLKAFSGSFIGVSGSPSSSSSSSSSSLSSSSLSSSRVGFVCCNYHFYDFQKTSFKNRHFYHFDHPRRSSQSISSSSSSSSLLSSSSPSTSLSSSSMSS